MEKHVKYLDNLYSVVDTPLDNLLNNAVVMLIKSSIEKGLMLSFQNVLIFHDAKTFNIFLHKDGKCVFESERVSFNSSDEYLKSEIKKILIYLESQER